MHPIAPQKKNRGFTLVELMVTITVMLIITSISIFNYSEFNSATVTNTLAYDIALAIRQAQSYGVAVRAGTSDTDFDIAYGVHFGANKENFSLFADTDNKLDYDENELLQTYTLQAGSKITSVCVDITKCDRDTIILFKRPDPESIVKYDGALVQSGTVTITIQNITETLTRIITVYPTGQISVSSPKV
jgi:prepilin-type N-terminal cleavage/methylation domain-containing protein